MMLRKNFNWDESGDNGIGDALWRTGFAYVAYALYSLKAGILSCFKDGKIYRYPGYGSEDVSRDQITSALISFKLNNQTEDLHKLIDLIPNRISEKFRLTLDMRAWMKALKGSKYNKNLFLFYSNIVMSFSLPWNRFIYWLFKVKIIAPEILKKYEPSSKLEKTATTLHYPAYALHLFAWQLACIDDCRVKRKIQRKCLRYIMKIDSSNYLLRILFKGDVSIDEISSYKPMTGIRWQCIFVKNRYNSVKIIEEYPIYNALDKDLLIYAYNNLR